ncbi:MAG: SMC-Scp complex subunit ScpB [Methanosarcinales archaeon]|nr:SMC-Scp complex subunit ScpB [ANME-2 cluster archaeon]MDF1531161.1 SMC-Scp complex subunit ScpB [ANME-2 cluster archaeon]MDW7776939.1 SMC-Scp complex subunit ScpB [Methanosarcinales archaeon]
MFIGDREIIEAALFAAGGPVESDALKELVSKRNKVPAIIESLVEEYRQRQTGLEIIELEGKYVMQVKPEYAEHVRSVAPRELPSPILRTLSMIAYHQPLLQSDLVEKRGNATYDHVRELEERGLIKRTPQGRSMMLSTTHGFAEYFGLESSEPEYVKQKIIEMVSHDSQVGLDKWLGVKRPIGVTRGYLSLMFLLGIEDFKVVEPYHPTQSEIERMNSLGRLVIAKGYGEKAAEYFNGEIIEIQAVTFDDLLTTIDKLSNLGTKDKVNAAVEKIKTLKSQYLSRAMGVSARVKPGTEMVSRLVSDMKLNVSARGMLVAPDYGLSSDGVDVSRDADILVPTHKNASDDIVERVCQRYEAILNGIAAKEFKL